LTGRVHFSSPLFQSIVRLGTGIFLAFVFYHLAQNFATSDCRDMQINLQERGYIVLGQLLLVATIVSMLGVPATLIAVLTGTLTGPLVGAPLASAAITISSLLLWGAGRVGFSKRRLPEFIDQRLDKSIWFKNMMNDRAASGFQWTALHGLLAPIPYPFVSFLIGAKVRHLNPQSFIAGIFAGSILQVAGYSLAGASIGCAVINHAVGVSFEQYRTLMVVSCLILILLARLQNTINKNKLNGANAI
jgi:uncharacterized membrane protein YdjX (TVP38/TMEM64 family)